MLHQNPLNNDEDNDDVDNKDNKDNKNNRDNNGDDVFDKQMEEAVELTHRVKHRRDVCFSQVIIKRDKYDCHHPHHNHRNHYKHYLCRRSQV